ncbi:hypothetical protein GPN2_13603 [Streptomyces murinus]
MQGRARGAPVAGPPGCRSGFRPLCQAARSCLGNFLPMAGSRRLWRSGVAIPDLAEAKRGRNHRANGVGRVTSALTGAGRRRTLVI